MQSCDGVGVARHGALVLLSALIFFGCNKDQLSGEECAAVAGRLAPVIAGGRDQPIEAGKLQNLVERCKNSAEGSVTKAIFRCSHLAKDEEGIRACFIEVAMIDAEPSSSNEAHSPGRRDLSSEAELQLAKLKTNAKAAFNTDSSYPGVTAPLTPATPCCEQPGKRCAVKATDWATFPWQALDFQIDEPFHFQYSYTGTATTYVATAVGDPGCTGEPVTYVLEGSVVNGNPTSSLTKPAPR